MKEGQEEANLDPDYAAKRMVSCGIVTFLYDVSRGIYPCGEFVFDLELDKVDCNRVYPLGLSINDVLEGAQKLTLAEIGCVTVTGREFSQKKILDYGCYQS